MNTVPTTTDYSIVNTTAVLPDRLVDDAIVVVRNGTIDEIVARSMRNAQPDDAIDAHGAFTVPGAIDLHSDGLEKELRPRPGVELPMDFALRSFEGRVRGAGVTTVFHGIGFENSAKYERSVAPGPLDVQRDRAPRRSGPDRRPPDPLSPRRA